MSTLCGLLPRHGWLAQKFEACHPVQFTISIFGWLGWLKFNAVHNGFMSACIMETCHDHAYGKQICTVDIFESHQGVGLRLLR